MSTQQAPHIFFSHTKAKVRVAIFNPYLLRTALSRNSDDSAAAATFFCSNTSTNVVLPKAITTKVCKTDYWASRIAK